MSRPDPRAAGAQVYLDAGGPEPAYVGQLSVDPKLLQGKTYVVTFYEAEDLSAFRLAAEMDRFGPAAREIRLGVCRRSHVIDGRLLAEAPHVVKSHVPPYAQTTPMTPEHAGVRFVWPALLVKAKDMDDLFDCDEFEPAS